MSTNLEAELDLSTVERLPTKGLGGRRKRKPERHDEILLVAVRLFNSRGYAATSIDEIAAGVGVSSAAVYRHFQTKQAILDTAALWIDGQLMDLLLKRLSRARTPSGRVKGIVDDLVETAVNEPDFVGLMVRELNSLSAPVRTVCLEHRDHYVERWCDVLAEALPRLSRPEARLRVNCVIGLVCSLSVNRELRKEETTRVVSSMSLAALRAPAGPVSKAGSPSRRELGPGSDPGSTRTGRRAPRQRPSVA